MFIVIGILSILAGCFVFWQASLLSLLSQWAINLNSVTGAFAVLSFALILAGAFSIASKEGKNRGFVWTVVGIYAVATIVSYKYSSARDMELWAIICPIIGGYYLFCLFNTRRRKSINRSEDEED